MFRASAYKFNLSRRACRGHWRLGSGRLTLIDGSCDLNTPINSTILQGLSMAPNPLDILPSLAHSYEAFVKENSTTLEPWIGITHAVSVAASFWARAAYISKRIGPESNYVGPYKSANETITSIRPTLDNQPALYIVLAVQPTITLVAIVITTWLYRTPLSRNFGLRSILKGFDPSSSQISYESKSSSAKDRQMRLEILKLSRESSKETKVSYRVVPC